MASAQDSPNLSLGRQPLHPKGLDSVSGHQFGCRYENQCRELNRTGTNVLPDDSASQTKSGGSSDGLPVLQPSSYLI